MRVYRFLSERYALISVQEQRLKVSRLEDLNDPFEWAPPRTSRARQRAAFNHLKSEISKNNGVICFSKSWNSPLLWSHYADKHQGIALGFDFTDLYLDHVKYRKSRIDCDWQKFDEDEAYSSEIMRKVMQSKSDFWKYEDEARCYVKLSEAHEEGGIFFQPFSDDLVLREVVVGHQSNLTRSSLKMLVSHVPNKVTLKKARLAFRSYEVVNQRKREVW